MISLGAAVVRESNAEFYVELRPISDEFVPKSLAVSRLDRDALLQSAVDPQQAMSDFKRWLKELGGRPVFASFSSWDWAFVYYYLIRFGGGSPFGHSSMDIKSLYMGKYGSSWGETAKGSIARQRGYLLDGLGPHTHNALDDAREQAALLRRILEDEVRTG